MEIKEVSEMTQEEFKNKDYYEEWKKGFIVFTVYGYTIQEIKKLIDFAKSKNFNPNIGLKTDE